MKTLLLILITLLISCSEPEPKKELTYVIYNSQFSDTLQANDVQLWPRAYVFYSDKRIVANYEWYKQSCSRKLN